MKHIAYAPDDKYTNQTVVSMQSAFENNKDVEFIITYSQLSETSVEKLKQVGAPVRFLKVSEDDFQDLALSKWVTVQAWFRIKLPELCPDLSKILYLDCDTLVLGDLSELFKIDLTNKYLAGVKDVWGVEKYVKRLKMQSGVYINSGMLLLNCDYCRENNFTDKIIDFANSNKKIIEFCDQDSINKIADTNKLVVSPKYNFMDTWWRGGYYEFDGEEEVEYLKAKENPVIVHLTGLKPAFKGCGNKYADVWWQYAKNTKIYDELLSEYNLSQPPNKKTRLLNTIFSITNEYSGKTKYKYLTLFGIKILIKKSVK